MLELKRKAATWLEIKKEASDVQKQLSAIRKRLKVAEEDLHTELVDQQLEQVECEDGTIIQRRRNVNIRKTT